MRSHYVQSSPLIEFLGPEYLALQWVSRDLSALDELNFFFKHADSDSPDDEESESIIRISVAQSSAKLYGSQRKRHFKESFRRVFGIWATARQQKVV